MLIRVYYEDTDAAGVVYHANYLNYLERARTEFLRELGWSVADLATEGMIFPVVRMEVDFRTPARHDQLVRVTTTPVTVRGSAFVLNQRIERDPDGLLLVQAQVTLACVSPQIKPRRLPPELRTALVALVSV